MRPKQADLRRSLSSAYYALFHSLARSCADMLVGGQGSDRSRAAWAQVYRALEHGEAKKRCKSEGIRAFPKEIVNFANLFVEMQEKRHLADYDPQYRTTRSEVVEQIEAVKAVIDQFASAPSKDRRAFAVWILMKAR